MTTTVRGVAQLTCLLVVVLALVALTVQGPAPAVSAPGSPARVVDPLPFLVEPDPTARGVKARVLTRLRGISERAHVAVSVRDEASEATFDFGSDRFPTASLVKIHLVALMLWRAEQSSVGLTAAQHQDAEAMLVSSENEPALRTYFALGGKPGIEEGLKAAFGSAGVRIGDQGYWGHSTTRPRAVVALLHRVLDADSARTFSVLQDAMSRVVPEQRWGISALADEGSIVQLKVGWVEDPDGWIVNSSGRVIVDGSPMLISVMTDRNPTRQAGIATIEKVARLAGDVVRAERTSQQNEVPFWSLLRRSAVQVG